MVKVKLGKTPIGTGAADGFKHAFHGRSLRPAHGPQTRLLADVGTAFSGQFSMGTLNVLLVALRSNPLDSQ